MTATLDPAFITLAGQLADAAGDVLRRHFRTAYSVETKADASPVTIADRECEIAIRALIEAKFPDHGIIGEELGNVREGAQYQWVIDPIDGTRAFIAGYPIFTTLIALAKGGVPVLGIIDQPVTGERWVGIAGSPTTLNGKPVSVRPIEALKPSVIATTSSAYFTTEETAAFQKLMKQCGRIVLSGDAYAYAMLATGQMDIVADAKLKPYDFAALKPVIEGAGGIVTDWQGAPVTLKTDGYVLAAGTKALHALALKVLTKAA